MSKEQGEAIVVITRELKAAGYWTAEDDNRSDGRMPVVVAFIRMVDDAARHRNCPTTANGYAKATAFLMGVVEDNNRTTAERMQAAALLRQDGEGT